MRAAIVGLLGASALAGLAPKRTPTPVPRRIALRAAPNLPDRAEWDRIVAAARRRGVEIAVGPEDEPVPKGWEAVLLSAVPPSEALRARLSSFPVTFETGGFLFDGRAYREKGDAILLAAPGPAAETFVLGNAPGSVAALAARRLFRREEPPADYVVVSGELSKEGRFVGKDGTFAVDRSADRDRIADRDAFFRALRHETRGVVEWQFREEDRGALAKWEPVTRRFAGKRGFAVRLFPDAVTKALYTGSSRTADLSDEGGRVLVDIDVSAPAEPDLVAPALAAAARSAAEPSLGERPVLRLAAGARRFGRWWGREIKGFAAFLRAAGVEPTVAEVLDPPEDLSPVLAVGAAASWLDAGARLDGEAAADRAIAGPEKDLRGKLERWREAAGRQPVAPPPRRALPPGFLRGVSYAMTNAIEEGYASRRSGETLRRLEAESVNSVSLMPYGFSPDARSDRILFVHRRPQGETDEGTLRAAADARALGMTVMIKPQLWLGGGAWVGDVAMRDEASWRSWFSSYRRFLVHHAVIAEASGAALFCVGTELKATEAREKEWRDAIAAVRLATGAPLLYAANWAVHAANVPFWDALDAIGVDFYDPLGSADKLSDAALEQGARAAARPLAEVSRKLRDKPVIFTEAGYPPLRAAWIAPHDEDAPRPVGPEDAARSIAAVYRALSRESWWRGVYWWKVFSDGRAAPAGERGFNLLGTPAEKAVVEGFRAIGTPR